MLSTGSVLAWPLVGRIVECEQIAHARASGARAVVLHGAAGVGKSRLAREALAEAAREGALTMWLQATRSAAGVPLGAFAGVIPVEVRSDDRFELMRGSVRALSDLAGARELVLGVDDAHLLDPTSAALVLHLITTEAAFVLATVRSGESCPDAIVSLWKDAGGRRVELSVLGEAQTGELAEAIVDGPVEQRVRQWVWDASRGNALYVRELVLGALGAGALREQGGLWRMPVRPAVSASLMELVTARMAGLAEREMRLLELLALGEPLRVSELLDLVGGGPLEVIERHGLVTVEGSSAESQVRLAHPLYGETIRASLPTLRARELRLRLAATVQARGELTAADTLRVARWLLDIGEPIPTALLLSAARAANLSGDPDLGAELAARALRAGGGIEASLLLARAHAVRNRFEEAENALAEIERRLPDQEAAIEYLRQRIAVLYWGLRRPDAPRALLERATEWWSEEAWQRRLDPLRLFVGKLTEGFGTTLEVSAETLSDTTLDDYERRQMEAAQAANLFYVGRTREAFELVSRLRPAVPLRSLSEEMALALWITVALEAGYGWSGLERWASAALVDAVRADDHGSAGLAALALGCLRLQEGRLVSARRWLVEAELHFARRDELGILVITHAFKVRVAAAAGDSEGAGDALRGCREAIVGGEPLPHHQIYLARAEAWCELARNDSKRAERQLLDAAGGLSTMPVYAAQLSYDALLAGAGARRIAQALAALGSRTDAPLVAAYAAHADARAAADAPALMEVSRQFEQIGALRFAMDAAAHAADAFATAGRQDSARRAAARARKLFAAEEGARAPVIEGLGRPAVGLTRREAELVELASRGLSNAEIAERLVLSVRTVESHLYRAMQKLAISDRRQL